jgi:hypothetical protein
MHHNALLPVRRESADNLTVISSLFLHVIKLKVIEPKLAGLETGWTQTLERKLDRFFHHFSSQRAKQFPFALRNLTSSKCC